MSRRRKRQVPRHPMATAMGYGLMAMEAQAVIAMRLMGMAGLWSVPKTENLTMVSEKAFAAAQSAIAAGGAAMAGKGPEAIAAAALKPVRKATKANVKRLAKRGPA